MRHPMTRLIFNSAAALLAAALVAPAQAQQAQRPPTEVTKVDGTDGVYIWRNGNHQAMFIVTKDGVIATDPIAYGRPTGGQQYVDAIKKTTDKPIKYLIYSHHHYDHIAGGKAFKDAGAKIIAHKRAKERLAALKPADIPLPDQVVDRKRTIKLGGTTLELVYTGRNHSDSSLVMFLPKEKIIFAVDFNSLGAVPSRLAVNDSYPVEWEESLKRTLALQWERMIPGHPGPNGRFGNRQDMEQQLAYLTDLTAEVKKAGGAGKCFEPATKEVRLPKHATLAGYEQNIEWNVHRWCGYFGRGI